jgi:hypothetical protein
VASYDRDSQKSSGQDEITQKVEKCLGPIPVNAVSGTGEALESDQIGRQRADNILHVGERRNQIILTPDNKGRTPTIKSRIFWISDNIGALSENPFE